jgi:hypothetical protein
MPVQPESDRRPRTISTGILDLIVIDAVDNYSSHIHLLVRPLRRTLLAGSRAMTE